MKKSNFWKLLSGTVFFAAVALARKAGVDPEEALQQYNADFLVAPESH